MRQFWAWNSLFKLQNSKLKSSKAFRLSPTPHATPFENRLCENVLCCSPQFHELINLKSGQKQRAQIVRKKVCVHLLFNKSFRKVWPMLLQQLMFRYVQTHTCCQIEIVCNHYTPFVTYFIFYYCKIGVVRCLQLWFSDWKRYKIEIPTHAHTNKRTPSNEYINHFGGKKLGMLGFFCFIFVVVSRKFLLSLEIENWIFTVSMKMRQFYQWNKLENLLFFLLLLLLIHRLPLVLMSIAYFKIICVLWKSDTIPGHRESCNQTHTTRTLLPYYCYCYVYLFHLCNDDQRKKELSVIVHHRTLYTRISLILFCFFFTWIGTRNTVGNSSTMSQLRARRKAAKMLVVVVVMFAICYLPVHCLNILR